MLRCAPRACCGQPGSTSISAPEPTAHCTILDSVTNPSMMPSPLARSVRRPSHFLKGARLDLSNPLAGDAKLDGELVEGERRIDEPARLEDVTFAVIENG